MSPILGKPGWVLRIYRGGCYRLLRDTLWTGVCDLANEFPAFARSAFPIRRQSAWRPPSPSVAAAAGIKTGTSPAQDGLLEVPEAHAAVGGISCRKADPVTDGSGFSTPGMREHLRELVRKDGEHSCFVSSQRLPVWTRCRGHPEKWTRTCRRHFGQKKRLEGFCAESPFAE